MAQICVAAPRSDMTRIGHVGWSTSVPSGRSPLEATGTKGAVGKRGACERHVPRFATYHRDSSPPLGRAPASTSHLFRPLELTSSYPPPRSPALPSIPHQPVRLGSPTPRPRTPRRQASSATRDDGRRRRRSAHGHGRASRAPPSLLLGVRHPANLQAAHHRRPHYQAAAGARCSATDRGGRGAAAAGADAGRRAGGGGRVRDPRGPELRAGAPARHGRTLRLHALGRLPRLAVAPGPHRPGRDQRAQETSQARRRRAGCRRRRSGRRRLQAHGRSQVRGRDQDRRAHRGAEEAGEGVVQGPAFQRGFHPAGAGRARVSRRRAQHLVPDGETLPGAAPLRRSGHHGAVGGRGGAGAGDAEGERDGQEPAHRAQRPQRPALHLADTHRTRDRRQGLRVHHMAMMKLMSIWPVLAAGDPSADAGILQRCFLALHVSSLPSR